MNTTEHDVELVCDNCLTPFPAEHAGFLLTDGYRPEVVYYYWTCPGCKRYNER